jgi:hypothetical protein
MTTTEKKKLKITMSDRAPITIVEDDWGLVASADWFTGEIKVQANEVAVIKVREHRDGRRIVYGFRDRGNGGMPISYRGTNGGFLVPAVDLKDTMRQPDDDGPLVGTAPDSDATVRAIRRVAGVIDMADLADECIADLPSQDLV